MAHLSAVHADLARLAFMLGWRKGEVRSLTAANVDLATGELRLADSKNGDGRVIPLRNEHGALNGVGQLLERRLAARTVGNRVVPWLFHYDGQPVGDFRKAWASACVKAGFSKPKRDKHGRPMLNRRGEPIAVASVLFHDLRRSFAKDAVESGADFKSVMDVGGWKTVATFHRYQIVDTRQMARTLSRLEGAREASAASNVVLLKAGVADRRSR